MREEDTEERRENGSQEAKVGGRWPQARACRWAEAGRGQAPPPAPTGAVLPATPISHPDLEQD